MENVRIIYSNPDGSVGILVPAPNCGLTIDEIAAKDVPAGCPFEIVSASAIPTDRTFRGAWRKNGFHIETNLDAAKEIQRDRIRVARAPLLASLDVEYTRAVEKGADTTAIVAEKQRLRDAPADPRIDAATTTEELKTVAPAGMTL